MRFLILLALLLASRAEAQSVVNADMAKLQPQIARDAKGFSSCGMRAVVVVGVKDGHTYDFSVNVYPDSLQGMIKAGKYRSTAFLSKSASDLKAVLPAPVSFWFAASDQGVPLKPAQFIPAETEGFILGSTDFSAAFTAITDMATGKQVQFAVRYKKEHVDQVVSFSASLSKTDADALAACFGGLQTRIKSLEASTAAQSSQN